MVVVLLIIIIIILVPSLIGIAAGTAIAFMPMVIAGIAVGLVFFFLAKCFGVSDEEILCARAKQAIDDKYTAFYVICEGEGDAGRGGPEPRFEATQLSGWKPSDPKVMRVYAEFGWSTYKKDISKVLDALQIPYQTDDAVDTIKDNIDAAYKQGKANYYSMKWYKGNGWNKLLSDSSNGSNVYHLYKEVMRILEIKLY